MKKSLLSILALSSVALGNDNSFSLHGVTFTKITSNPTRGLDRTRNWAPTLPISWQVILNGTSCNGLYLPNNSGFQIANKQTDVDFVVKYLFLERELPSTGQLFFSLKRGHRRLSDRFVPCINTF